MVRKVGVELLCLTVNFGKYNGNARHNYHEIFSTFISEYKEQFSWEIYVKVLLELIEL